MFELEMLVAFGIGAGLMALAPAVSAVTGGSKLSRSMSETGRDLTKRGLKLGVVVADKVSEASKSVAHNVAELGESFNDLVAEARADLAQERAGKASANGTSSDTVTEVTIEG
ncbi:MAG: hypothetical protein ACK5N0_02070 [Synechococcaceae cyanobacterium]